MNALPPPAGRRSLALLCLGNSRQVRFAVIAAAMTLKRDGQEVTIVNLTQDVKVRGAVTRMGIPLAEAPKVLRPEFIPLVTESPFGLGAQDWDALASATARQGFTLVLADLDPAVGVDHLKAWADDVIVAVTSGQSSVELVRTAGDLVRAAGLRLRCGILLGAERNDNSSGVASGAASSTSALLPAGTVMAGPTPPALEPAGSRRRDDGRSLAT